MTFAITPTGICANIPIFMWRGEVFADLYWSSGSSLGRRIFLHLELDLDGQASSSHRLSYQVGKPRLGGTRIGLDRQYFGVCPPNGPSSWKEVLIRHRPPLHRAPGQLPDSATSTFTPAIPMQLTFDAPVRFPEAHIRQFLMQSGSDRVEIRGAGVYSPWTAASNLPTAYVFRWYIGLIVIRVGHCHQNQSECGQLHRREAIWARTEYYAGKPESIETKAEIGKVSTDPLHDCSQDHILQWPNFQKMFQVNYSEEVTLSVTPCPLNPERTLILKASYRSRWKEETIVV